jgi:hypothetical protein
MRQLLWLLAALMILIATGVVDTLGGVAKTIFVFLGFRLLLYEISEKPPKDSTVK